MRKFLDVINDMNRFSAKLSQIIEGNKAEKDGKEKAIPKTEPAQAMDESRSERKSL